MDNYGYSLVDQSVDNRVNTGAVVLTETITSNVTVNITLPTIGSLELKGILDETLKMFSLNEKDIKMIILTILARRPLVKMERDGSRTLNFNHSVTWTYSTPYPALYQNVILGRRRYHGEFGSPGSKKLGMVTISGTVFASRRNHETVDGINELLIRDHSSTLAALKIRLTSGINPGLEIEGAGPPPYHPRPSAPSAVSSQPLDDSVDVTGVEDIQT